MALIDQLDFKLAFSRILKDMDDDPYPDLLFYHDIRFKKDEFLEEISDSLANERFRPSIYRPIEIPKPNFTLRPAGYIDLKDRLVYQALIDLLAPHYEPESSVLSYRLAAPRSSRMYKNGVQQWMQFEAEIEELCHKYPFVLETDLTGYFEHIHHHRLFRRLDDVFVDIEGLPKLKEILGTLLASWGNNTGFGIPQICYPSSFLGNFYLDEFDKWMVRKGYAYRRYVDDMRVFAYTLPEARRILAEMIKTLRELGLYISTEKTRILPTDTVIQEFDVDREIMTTIDEAFQSRRRSLILEILPLLEDFFLSSLKPR